MEEPKKQNDEIQIVHEFQNIYSPSTILGVFANALKSPVNGKIILAKGEFQPAQNSIVIWVILALIIGLIIGIAISAS